jgi:hypothetical protein
MIACGGVHGTSKVKNVRFIGFDSDKNTCGSMQRAITTNGMHSDYLPIGHFEDINFHDTDETGMFWMFSPP